MGGREVGGNRSELLKKVAETIREREYLQRQVQTLSAEEQLFALGQCVFRCFVRHDQNLLSRDHAVKEAAKRVIAQFSK